MTTLELARKLDQCLAAQVKMMHRLELIHQWAESRDGTPEADEAALRQIAALAQVQS